MKSYLLKGHPTFHKVESHVKVDESKVILVCKGNIELIIENEAKPYQSKSLIVLFPWIKYSLKAIGKDFIKIQMISFYLHEVLNPLLNSLTNQKNNTIRYVQLDQNQFLHISQLMRILHYNINYNNINQENIQANRYLLNSILLEINNTYQYKLIQTKPLLNLYSPLVPKFLFLVSQNYKKEHSVNFYATQLGITRRYLAKIIKKTTQKTPKTIIENTLNQEALNLLLQSNYNLNQISDELGFHSYPNFLLFFKKHNGLNPSTYRKISN